MRTYVELISKTFVVRLSIYKTNGLLTTNALGFVVVSITLVRIILCQIFQSTFFTSTFKLVFITSQSSIFLTLNFTFPPSPPVNGITRQSKVINTNQRELTEKGMPPHNSPPTSTATTLIPLDRSP